jgi:hypothetical protein
MLHEEQDTSIFDINSSNMLVNNSYMFASSQFEEDPWGNHSTPAPITNPATRSFTAPNFYATSDHKEIDDKPTSTTVLSKFSSVFYYVFFLMFLFL